MGDNLKKITEYSIEDLFNEIESRKVFLNRETFQDWLFEYACETCEYEGISPTKDRGYINYLMKFKLYCVLEFVDKTYRETNEAYTFTPFSKEDIPAIIEEEHQG